MSEEHVILSERPEDLKKAVEWGREQQKQLLDEKGEQLAEVLMEKMTPLILQKNTTRQCEYYKGISIRIIDSTTVWQMDDWKMLKEQ